jgi:hypothetical protein
MRGTRVLLAVFFSGQALALAQPTSDVPGTVYDGNKDQFTITLPQGWNGFDQTQALLRQESKIGVVIFSAEDLSLNVITNDQEALKARRKILAEMDLGAIPSFFVDRQPAEAGMTCFGLSPQAARRLITKLKGDPIWEKGRRVVQNLAPAPLSLGGCEGLHIRGSTQKKDGTEWVMDVRAVSDGETLYLFSLRCVRSYFEQNVGLYESALETLRLAAAK